MPRPMPIAKSSCSLSHHSLCTELSPVSMSKKKPRTRPSRIALCAAAKELRLRTSPSAAKGITFILLLFACACSPAAAANLQKPTVEAFDRYIRLTDARIEGELRDRRPFLWVDALPDVQRQRAYSQLRTAQVVIERLETRDYGRSIDVPDGLIHHWIGTAFIPGSTLQKTVALVQDYDRHSEIYKPEVIRSKVLQ